MNNSAKNLKFVDVPTECYYPAFMKDKGLCYEYYRTFLLNDDIYNVGDFAVVNGSKDIEVVKFICIYTNHQRKAEAVVRKYKFARNLKHQLIKEVCTEFDEGNEVVEDFTRDYVIKLEQVIKKCYLVFTEKEEKCSNVIKEYGLDPFLYFCCRYTLKSDGIFPVFSPPQMILCENNSQSPRMKLNSAKKQKRKAESENMFTNLDDDCDFKSTEDKIKSPKNPYKNIKISESNINTNSPIQRNLVKRNLNETFGDSPSKMEKSILNYSIVSEEDSNNPLIMTLKASKTNKTSIVLAEKFEDDISEIKEKKSQNQVEQLPMRKSSRTKERKSYAEYVSPIKSTPVKRGSVGLKNNEKNSHKRRATRKIEKYPETPTKSLQKSDDPNLRLTNSKRLVKTPRRYQDEMYYSEDSVRRSRQLTQTEDYKEITSSPRSCRKSKRHNSITSDGEEHKSNIGTPETKVNLDESMRRSILKVRINPIDLEEKKVSERDSTPTKKRQCKAPKKFYYDSSSDDETAASKNKTISSALLATPKTPKTGNKKTNTADFITKTPKTGKTKGTPRSLAKQMPNIVPNQTPKTPKNRAKLIRDGLITPSMQSRNKAVEGDSTPLMKARSQLHVSYVPTALPCREKEYCDIFNFLEGKLLDGCGGCMYISGVPGTGKTATVTSVINNLLKNDDVPKFSYVSINGMRLTEPRQGYVEIMKQLTGKTVPWEQAQSMLEERFTKSKKLAPVIILIDELDILCTKRQDVVYNMLDWPTKANNQLIVVTIANTMDLPERLLMNRVTSRLGLTRLTFQAYTYKQLQEIVTKRLSGIDSFNPDAVQFVARKVASVSGDARRALDICRRAAEIAEIEGTSQLVNMNHVNEALNAMITQPKVRAIKNCARLEQLILQSIVAEVERTGVEETTFADIFKMLVSCSAIDGFRMVSTTVALSAVSRLSACRLILTDQKSGDNQKIILNVSEDDVYYALKRD